MALINEKVKLLLDSSINMNRAQMVSSLKRYRGWELVEIANFFGYECSKKVSKTVALQIVLQHLISYGNEQKVNV